MLKLEREEYDKHVNDPNFLNSKRPYITEEERK